MNPSDTYPELDQFFGWFNQDWHDDVVEGADWPDVVDSFVLGQGQVRTKGTIRELESLLATDADDAELDQILDALDCNYLPDGGRTRLWLMAIRDRLAASVA